MVKSASQTLSRIRAIGVCLFLFLVDKMPRYNYREYNVYIETGGAINALENW